MTLRQGAVSVLVLGVLSAASAAMVGDAVWGGDWPGWDEGWAIVAFPLGVPLAIGTGMVLSPSAGFALRVAIVSGAVWCWGALLFLLWFAAG